MRKNIQLIARLKNSEYTERVCKSGKNKPTHFDKLQKIHASTFRLEGGGRKVKFDAVENGVLNIYRECRDKSCMFQEND